MCGVMPWGSVCVDIVQSAADGHVVNLTSACVQDIPVYVGYATGKGRYFIT